AARGLAHAGRELHEEALEEQPLVPGPVGAAGVRAEVAADQDRSRMVRGHDGDELLVERGLAVQVGGEKPFGQAATPPRLDKGMTNAEDRNLSEALRRAPQPRIRLTGA